jgi:hypothetical protein
VNSFARACGAPHTDNESIHADLAFVHDDLRRMRADPVVLPRPVLVLGGYHTWAPVPLALARTLCDHTSQRPNDVFCVAFPLDTSIASAAIRTGQRVMHAMGSRENEMDAVGISMGGVVARVAHADESVPVRLARLFTLASPHSGALRADAIRVDQASRDLRAGSEVLRGLDELRSRGRDVPELYCYAQLGDRVVGAMRSAPAGHPLFWTGPTRFASHFSTSHNPWFLCDISRRLRGEEPLFSAPHNPPPRN